MIRAASVPAGHPFVVSSTDPDRVALRPDPVVPGATLPGQWWPPRWLDPAYIKANIAEIDVLHVHFGFETVPVADLRAVIETLRAYRVPLVVTVHDLANPHLRDQSRHRERLELLLRAASAVITLTPGAARVITDRWGVAPTVLPHPHLLPLESVGAQRDPAPVPVVAMHAKFLRENVDPWPLMDALLASGLPSCGTAVRFDMDQNATASPRADREVSERLDRYRAAGVDVRIHPPFTDAGLVDYLTEIDVMVLPYRFGTHSGWVEACFDAGVSRVVPDCGFFHQQQAAHLFGFGLGYFDAPGLLQAVERAVAEARERPHVVDRSRCELRLAQRSEVRREIVRIYRRVLDERDAA